MGGVLGLILVVVGLVLVYDVIAGKSQTIANLINGQEDILQPITSSASSGGITGSGNGSIKDV